MVKVPCEICLGGEINKKREMGGMGNINTKDKTGEGRMGRRDEKKSMRENKKKILERK